MQSISHILNTTGLGQDMLADYAGIKRQNLMKAAIGMIDLDAATVIKLSRLQHTIESVAMNEKKNTAIKVEPAHDAEQEMACRYRALVLQKRLEELETTQRKYNHLLYALELFEPADEQEILWVQRTKSFIIKKLDGCGVATCRRLRKRVYLLSAEADYIQQFEKPDQAE